jgi:hypothetical protein
MRRLLKRTVLTLLLLIVGVTVAVQLRSINDPLPAPDPRQPIHLDDGRVMPLADVLVQARAVELPAAIEATPGALAPASVAASPPATASGPTAEELVAAALAHEPQVFRLAEAATRAGRLDEALALYQSVPEGDPGWALAQRRIAWNILTEGRDEPRRAVSYVQAALEREPFKGNSWHDLARVYAATLGIHVR